MGAFFGVTLNGMYEYSGHTLFNGFQFPDNTFDRAHFISCLIRRWGMQNPYIQSFEALRSAISDWSYEQQHNFQMLYDAFESNYNPIHNYDRTEERTGGSAGKTAHSGNDLTSLSGSDSNRLSGNDTVKQSGSDAVKQSGTDVDELSGTDTETHTGTDNEKKTGTESVQHGGSDTDIRSNRAYNSGTLTVVEKNEHQRASNDTTTFDTNDATTHGHTIADNYGKRDTITYGKTDTTTYGKTDTTEYGKVDTTEYGRKESLEHGHVIDESEGHHDTLKAFGNIGVTTTTKMLELELDLRKRFNPYVYIADLFADEFLSKIF